jgi:hypothetical protein
MSLPQHRRNMLSHQGNTVGHLQQLHGTRPPWIDFQKPPTLFVPYKVHLPNTLQPGRCTNNVREVQQHLLLIG